MYNKYDKLMYSNKTNQNSLTDKHLIEKLTNLNANQWQTDIITEADTLIIINPNQSVQEVLNECYYWQSPAKIFLTWQNHYFARKNEVRNIMPDFLDIKLLPGINFQVTSLHWLPINELVADLQHLKLSTSLVLSAIMEKLICCSIHSILGSWDSSRTNEHSIIPWLSFWNSQPQKIEVLEVLLERWHFAKNWWYSHLYIL